MKRRERPVHVSECDNLPTVLVETMRRQGPERHVVRQGIEVGARAAAPQAHGRALLIEYLRDDGTRRSHFRVCTDEEIALLTDADAGNDPPQSGCIYEDQALIRPDRTTNYELGLRRSWRDGRFSASGTLFHVDWEDIQVAGLTPFSSEPITLNGGGAVSRGVELAASVWVKRADLADNLRPCQNCPEHLRPWYTKALERLGQDTDDFDNDEGPALV